MADQPGLNEMIAALMAGQQQLQVVMATFAANAQPAPVPDIPVQPPVPRPRLEIKGLTFAGEEEEFDDWNDSIRRTSDLEGWSDAQRRRAAIGTLRGRASTWHDSVGEGIPGWEYWLAAIRRTFVPELTESQWQQKVRNRTQGPKETGAQYVLSKVRILRRRPINIDEVGMVPFLIQGLRKSEHRTVMLVRRPGSLAEFIEEIEEVESLDLCGWEEAEKSPAPNEYRRAQSPTRSTYVAASQEHAEELQMLRQQVETYRIQLAEAIATVNQTGNVSVSRGVSPEPQAQKPRVTFAPSLPTMTTYQPNRTTVYQPNSSTVYQRNPTAGYHPRPHFDGQCYNCNEPDHFSGECPYPRRPYQGNAQTGSPGQNRS